MAGDASAGGPGVVIVDDHDFFRTGMAGMLERSGVRVLGAAADGESGMSLVHRLRPDVALMDLHMPGIGGIEAVRRLTAGAVHTKILVLTVSDDSDDVVDALIAGAAGYLLKTAPIQELVRAIRAAAEGDTVLAPVAVSRMVESVRATRPRPTSAPEAADGEASTGPEPLSRRETEVLALVAQGLDNAAIASALLISPNTVKNHVGSILLKLRVGNRIQAAVLAVRLGLV